MRSFGFAQDDRVGSVIPTAVEGSSKLGSEFSTWWGGFSAQPSDQQTPITSP